MGALNVRPHTYTFAPQLRLDASGFPLVAWQEDLSGVDNPYLWQNGCWVLLGDPAVHAGAVSGGADALGATVTVPGSGQVWVSWCEKAGELYRVRVRAFGKS